MSSDESDNDNESFSQNGYQWEPEYNEEELAEIERENQRRTSPVNERSSDLNWCLCNNCITMPTIKECNCCQEFEHYYEADYLSSTVKCVTQHCDFDIIC